MKHHVHKKVDRRSQLINRLQQVECPDTTFVSNTFPTVLKKGKGVYVTDVNNRKFLDFTSGFGTLALGHRSATTLKAIQKQSSQLIQGLGDVHPNESKIKLLELIAQITPYNTPKTMLGLSGGDAIEIAMKTAALATSRAKFLSFENGYHGVQLAPLNLNHTKTFTEGFEGLLSNHSKCLPFPYFKENGPQVSYEKTADSNHVLSLLEDELKTYQYAALILEPIQGRGGTRVFTKDFLQQCQTLCKKYGSLLVFDEIMTGFGRTGTLFAYEHSQVVPDLMCIGKGMGGGLPLSACVGDIMDVWKKSEGEARHTQTFLGYPLSCAVGYETILEIQKQLPKFQAEILKIEKETDLFIKKLPNKFSCFVRGKGFMHGLFFYHQAENFGVKLMNDLFQRSILALPEGSAGHILALLPSLTIQQNHYKILLNLLSKKILTY